MKKKNKIKKNEKNLNFKRRPFHQSHRLIKTTFQGEIKSKKETTAEEYEEV